MVHGKLMFLLKEKRFQVTIFEDGYMIWEDPEEYVDFTLPPSLFKFKQEKRLTSINE
jgi:hypothetical protein